MRSFVALCCSLVLLFPATGATAAPIDVGEAQIAFTRPPGYCGLDPKQALDARFVGRLERLGVFHAAAAVYYGMVAEVVPGDGRARDAVEVGAMILIKGKLVSYLLYGAFQGKASVDRMLALQRSNMDRLIAGN